MLEVFLLRQRLFSCIPFWWDYSLLQCSRILTHLFLLFLGIWVTGPSSTPWNMVLMNGLDPQTAILDLMITEHSQISLCIGTGKWLAGNSATCLPVAFKNITQLLGMFFSLLSMLMFLCWKTRASTANQYQWKGVGRTRSCFRIRQSCRSGCMASSLEVLQPVWRTLTACQALEMSSFGVFWDA